MEPSKLLHHVKEIYWIATEKIYAWTDTTIVLNWLDGSPRHFKTYVGNRVSATLSHIPSKCWNHVSGLNNPADCDSRGIFPNKLVNHELWWQGPRWLTLYLQYPQDAMYASVIKYTLEWVKSYACVAPSRVAHTYCGVMSWCYKIEPVQAALNCLLLLVKF